MVEVKNLQTIYKKFQPENLASPNYFLLFYWYVRD